MMADGEERAVRMNIMLRESGKERLDKLAADAGVSRSMMVYLLIEFYEQHQEMASPADGDGEEW